MGLFTLILLALPAAWAVDITSVDRPSMGTAAYTLEQGGLQIESGFQLDGSQVENLYTLPTMLRIGLHDQFELRPYTSMVNHSSSQTMAFQKSGIQGKLALYTPEATNIAIAVLASADMDVGSGMILVDAWKEDWSAWINAGHALGYDSTTEGSTLLITGLGYTLPNQQGLFVESSATISNTIHTTIQSGYSKTFKQLQLDVYAMKTLNTPGAWQVSTGLGWRIR